MPPITLFITLGLSFLGTLDIIEGNIVHVGVLF